MDAVHDHVRGLMICSGPRLVCEITWRRAATTQVTNLGESDRNRLNVIGKEICDALFGTPVVELVPGAVFQVEVAQRGCCDVIDPVFADEIDGRPQ